MSRVKADTSHIGYIRHTRYAYDTCHEWNSYTQYKIATLNEVQRNRAIFTVTERRYAFLLSNDTGWHKRELQHPRTSYKTHRAEHLYPQQCVQVPCVRLRKTCADRVVGTLRRCVTM